MRIWRIGAALAAWLAVVAASVGAAAQDSFPNRPVRIVIPYSAGSVADVFGRIVAQNMAAQWNGSIINEIKSGANGSIAAEEVARAVPDGYTWLLVTTFFSTSPSLYNNLRWDPRARFHLGRADLPGAEFLRRAPSLPVKSVRRICGAGEGKTGHAELQPPRQGSTGHLGFELFKRLAGIDVTRRRLSRLSADAADIASGLINSTFLSANQALAQVQTGSIRIIGAISDGRSKYFPTCRPWPSRAMPTAAGDAVVRHRGDRGHAEPIVNRISKALEAALAIAGCSRQKLDLAGCAPKSAPRAKFGDIITADVALWAKVVKDAGITAD